MSIVWRFPAKSIINRQVLGCRTQPLGATNDMGYFHKVVINDVCEMIRRPAITFEEHRIFMTRSAAHICSESEVTLLLATHNTIDIVMKCGIKFRCQKTNDVGLAFSSSLVRFFSRDTGAYPVVVRGQPQSFSMLS